MINSYAPQSGRVIKENGNIVNWADSIDSNGNLIVKSSNDVIQTTMQNGVSATGNGTVLNTSNQSFSVIDVQGTFVATVTFEATIDGTNFFAIPVVRISDGTLSTTTTSAGQFAFRCAGYQSVRARVSAYTSGSITAIGRAVASGQGHHSISVANTPTVVAGANSPQSGTVTIANGASLSGTLDLAGLTLIGIIMPSAWTAADITVQASLNNTDFFNVFDVFGSELVIKADASRYIPLTPSDFISFRYVKLRSGTSGTVVNQGASRTLTLVYRAV